MNLQNITLNKESTLNFNRETHHYDNPHPSRRLSPVFAILFCIDKLTIKLSNKQTFNPDAISPIFQTGYGVDQSTVPPLEHAPPGQEPVTPAKFDLIFCLFDQSFISLGNIIADINETLGTWFQRAGHAPIDNPITGIDSRYHSTMCYWASTRHPHGPSNHNIAFLDTQFPD